MNLLSHILRSFLNSELLPTLMQNVGLAFVTILIPVVLFIFSMEKEALFEWDKIVILDKVIEAKYLLISVGLIFVPLFIWDYGSDILKFILFLMFLCGVFYLTHILFNSYRWIKTVEIRGQHDSNNFRNILRNKYLEEVTNLEEKEKVWSLTWRKDIENPLDERNLIKKFMVNIDALVQSRSFDTLARYLQTFSEFIEKRALYDRIIFNELFSNTLKLRYLLFPDIKKQETEPTDSLWLALYEIDVNLKKLIKKLVVSSLQKANSFSFFKILKEHIRDKDTDYLRGLFGECICSEIFNNNADSNDRYDIWNHYFPPEWKITKETLQDVGNIVSKIWLNEFIPWAANRITSSEWGKDFDKNLDDVAKELFPSVEPMLWAKLLTFLFRHWSNSNRMKSLVEKGPNFGMSGRIFTSWGSKGNITDDFNANFRKAFEEQTQATFELALLLFTTEFRKDKLENFISELEGLTTPGKCRGIAAQVIYCNL